MPRTLQTPRAAVHVHPDAATLCRAAAEDFVHRALEAVAARGVFNVALSGGSTPKGMFAILASDTELRAAAPWADIRFFFGDERTVPPDHADSNYRMANDALLSKVPVQAKNVFRMRGEDKNPKHAAEDYEFILRSQLPTLDGTPVFDLFYLGMGPDGHTASLFPGTKALHDSDHDVVANWVGKFYCWRLSLTVKVINRAKQVIFLAAGDDKAAPLKAVLEGPVETEQLPSQLIRPANLLWLVDEAAAKMLEPR